MFVSADPCFRHLTSKWSDLSVRLMKTITMAEFPSIEVVTIQSYTWVGVTGKLVWNKLMVILLRAGWKAPLGRGRVG